MLLIACRTRCSGFSLPKPFIVADTVDEWLEENTPIDPDICRYMGMLFLSLANRLESKRN